VSDKTQDVLLEAAHWHNINNRRTAQKLKLFSEASARFSKGLPPEFTELGLKRGADLMRQYGGGTISKGFVDVYPKKSEPVLVELPVNESTRLLGVELSADDVVALLKPLDFECEIQGDIIHVKVPYYRLDVRRPADLVEEVARMYNYDKIPNRLLEDALPPQFDNPNHRGKLRVKRLLNQMGLQEVLNYTLTNPKTVQNFDPKRSEVEPKNYVELENTLSSDRSIMRQTMLPTMLETAEQNWRFQDRVTMFEIGRVFHPVAGEVLPNEPTHLGIVMFGQRHEVSWVPHEGDLDFFDLKGAIEGVLNGLYITSFETKPGQHSSFNPGRCAELFIGENSIGIFGELHPRVAEAFDLEGRICAAELNLDALLKHVADIPTYTPPPRFPSIVQDVALVVDQAVPNIEIETLIHDMGQPLLNAIRLFDVYTGEHVAEGKRSLAYSITYQAEDRTLTDEDVTQVHEKIQQGLKDKLNAEIRGLDA
jgi:phenylalanyl-tRNA synthetase beta chain